jgi:hypothetical protein
MSTADEILRISRELNYPNPEKLRIALAKRGIKARVGDLRELLTSQQGNRQIFAPGPRYRGHVVSQDLDSKWNLDIISYVATPDGPYRYVLVAQDVFSRYVWTAAMASGTEAFLAFRGILERSGRRPLNVVTDRDGNFIAKSFQDVCQKFGILHTFKQGLNDISPVDAAIRNLKLSIAKRTADRGTTWSEELQAATQGLNHTSLPYLLGSEPADVKGSKPLTFELRYKNANMQADNERIVQRRDERIKKAGGFRTALTSRSGLTQKGHKPRWSSDVHAVAHVRFGKVTDDKGRTYSTKIAQPSEPGGAELTVRETEKRGSEQINVRRREILGPFKDKLVQYLVDHGGTMAAINVQRVLGPEFLAAASEAKLNKNLQTKNFVLLFPDDLTFHATAKGGGSTVSLARPTE